MRVLEPSRVHGLFTFCRKNACDARTGFREFTLDLRGAHGCLAGMHASEARWNNETIVSDRRALQITENSTRGKIRR